MHKLGTLVEEGAVVFVCFHHKEGRTAKAGGNTKVLRHPANQKTGRHTRIFQQPGQQAGSRRLAVGAGYRQHPTILQYVTGQPFRAGHVGHALIEHVLHRRVTARHGITDNDQIRRRRKVRRVIALLQHDPLLGQLRAHGRVDVGIGAADLMAQFAGQ